VEAKNCLAKIKGVVGVGIVPVNPETGEQTPWPSGVKRPDQAGGKLPALPKKLPVREDICVRVYKGDVEQPGKKLEAGAGYDQAKKYYERINKRSGWRATWEAPGWPRPDIDVPKTQWVDIGPYSLIEVVGAISKGEQGDYYDVRVNGEQRTLECYPGADVRKGIYVRGRLPFGCRLSR
jgi:hypothetical protein